MTEYREASAGARALRAEDLAQVAALDAGLGGRSRRLYFERRLNAAQRDGAHHIQMAVDQGGRLCGWMLGRVLEGEFGRTDPQVRLEAFGVAAGAQHQGVGRALASAFEAECGRHGAAAIRTTVHWREHALLGFLDHCGFELAAVHVVDRAVAGGEGDTDGGDASALARDAMPVRTFREADIGPAVRIDRRHSGRDRRGFLCRALREALEDSAIRVSLAVDIDGSLAGFLMARVDYGDFGRTEPAAVIDTIGIDPMRARQGIGRALVSQLLANLQALNVERAETIVDAGRLDLLGFFYDAGFRPSERLALTKAL